MSVITNIARQRVLDLLKNEITHVGIGDGGIPSESSTHLNGELLRKPAKIEIDDEMIVVSATWNENEGNGITYKNAGCFCNGATDEIGTGELFTGNSINVVKDGSQSMNILIGIGVEVMSDV